MKVEKRKREGEAEVSQKKPKSVDLEVSEGTDINTPFFDNKNDKLEFC